MDQRRDRKIGQSISEIDFFLHFSELLGKLFIFGENCIAQPAFNEE